LSYGLLTLTENRPHGGNCRDQPDKGKGSPDRLSLLCAEPISEDKGDSCAKKGTRDDNKCEFWPGKFYVFHESTNRCVREEVKLRNATPVAGLFG
jgi:hypothetical protein